MQRLLLLGLTLDLPEVGVKAATLLVDNSADNSTKLVSREVILTSFIVPLLYGSEKGLCRLYQHGGHGRPFSKDRLSSSRAHHFSFKKDPGYVIRD